MLADYGDPVAAVQQLQRERSAQIAREYMCLAGVSRGRRLIWSGRPGVWYEAHLIDLGRRPDTTRAAQPADTVQEGQRGKPGRKPRTAAHAADILAFFKSRGNAPASAIVIADALGVSKSYAYKVLEKSDLFRVVHVSGGGGLPALYAPVGTSVPVNVADTLADAQRAIYDVLAAHGGAMSAQDLAIAAGVHGTTITRCYQKRPDVFATEYRGKSWHDGRRLYVWLVDQGVE